jgi:ABC-type transport system involved in cytochrome c biogenesis permease subunit
MSEALKQPAIITNTTTAPGLHLKETLRAYLPAILSILGSILMVLLRIKAGGAGFISDGALMMLALACYLTAAVFHLTNIYAPSQWAQKLGLWTTTLGVFFNLSSWGVRWITARDRELEIMMRNGGEMPWFFRYIPFANLYDLSLAFAFGAGITTLLIAHRKNFRFLGAVTLPLASIILLLARFIGNDFINLPPVLDSYWRPIHVGIASMSYGVALVCFALAVVYLLKDGVKVEGMAIWAAIFSVLVFGSINKFALFTTWPPAYGAATFLSAGGQKMPVPLRVTMPSVGWLLMLASLLLIGMIALFGKYILQHDEQARVWGHRLLKAALVVQALSIVLLVVQIKTMDNAALLRNIDTRQYERFGAWVSERSMGMSPEEIRQLSTQELTQNAQQFVQQRGSMLILSLNTNPVEVAALFTAFTAMLFVLIFSFRTEKLRAALPAAERLDSLMYKTGGVAFAGLALLLITGAVWANESWGAYWSWDSKEVGAFVAWLTYAGFLHARISRGMTGRRSAYFAVVAFLLVIFTYLGVSYLLPGLHSYA